MAEDHLTEVRQLFDTYDTDKDHYLSLNELVPLLQDLEARLTSLPAVSSLGDSLSF